MVIEKKGAQFVPLKRVSHYFYFPMRIGVIIPDRGDRPEFLKNCLRMMGAQTLRPDIVEVIAPPGVPVGNGRDITKRYRIGYDRLSGRVDVIAFIENDDWYSPDYLRVMAGAWADMGRPAIFGTNYTVYYHLKIGAYFTMTHNTRSSAMSTMIKPGLNITWPVDHEPFTDMHLWSHVGQMDTIRQRGAVFNPGKHICLGMKHGIGLCGGFNHAERLNRYRFPDHDQKFLRENLDEESFKFYSKFYEPDFIAASK